MWLELPVLPDEEACHDEEGNSDQNVSALFGVNAYLEFMKQNLSSLPPLILDRLDKLGQLCEEHKIKRLWLFGSAVRGDFRADSDIDVLYEFDDDNIPEMHYLTHFWGMWDGLEALWGRKVDFVHYPDLQNPYFKAAVDVSKLLIYDAEREKIPV